VAKPGGETQRSAPEIYATLEFEDDLGPQAFHMVKPFIRIGRRLKDDSLKNSIWVDLVVSVNANVSKEHCEIRYDGAKRAFFLRDTSKFGTAVNGKAAPKDNEIPLPNKARIRLADAVTLSFHVAR
jgi:pSer/pThr/pTyr-binding forkhead associated (FHA) protein